MRRALIQAAKQLPGYPTLRNLLVWSRQRRERYLWESRGRPPPSPHLVKQETLRDYARRYGIRLLVETGTYYGDMVDAMKRHFDRIYSIELSPQLHRSAARRFRREAHVELLLGDSARLLPELLARLPGPALFWLDGHYSAGETARGEKDTPILEEISHIMGNGLSGHVILVDDARCFDTDPAYPSIAALTKFVRARDSSTAIRVENDIIRITPGTHSSAGAT